VIKLRENNNLKDGLLDMIKYINSFSNTHEMDLIEIGSYIGESTVIFAEHFKQVYSIDPFIGEYDKDDFIGCKPNKEFDIYYQQFKLNTSKYSNIEHFKIKSDDFISNNLFDIVYIDGEHSLEQVKKDIENFLPKIKKGGFISGHDYYEDYGYVKPIVDQIFGKPDMAFQDASWIKRVE
jgi:hypothetical protein